MKTIYIVIGLLLFIICCKSNPPFYSGYIYNHEKKPLANIKIYEKDSKNNFAFTNSKGFFYLKRNKNWISDLIINYDNKYDTVRTIGKQGGEKIIYFFIDNNLDTLYVDTIK